MSERTVRQTQSTSETRSTRTPSSSATQVASTPSPLALRTPQVEPALTLNAPQETVEQQPETETVPSETATQSAPPSPVTPPDENPETGDMVQVAAAVTQATQAPTEDSSTTTSEDSTQAEIEDAEAVDAGQTETEESAAQGTEDEAATMTDGADAGAASAADAAQVELMIPEAPSEPSPATQRRIGGVQQRASQTAATQGDVPPATSQVADARGAASEPQEETTARAAGATVETLDNRAEPSAEIEELIARIKRVIREKRPTDEESLVDADPQEMAAESGRQMDSSVRGDAQRVQGEYDQMQEQPEGTPATEATPLAEQPEAGNSPDPDATQAAPDAIPAEDVSLDADVEANRQRMEDAGMMSETAQAVETGPIAEARDAQAGLEEQAERAPAEVLAEQDAAIANAQADMAALQAQAMTALEESRSTATGGSAAQQTEMVGNEEQMRAEVGRRANEIFTSAQSRVEALISDLPATAMARWEAGIEQHSYTFEQSLARVKRWIDERHESTVLAVWDAVTGLPDWVTEEYDRAEREFGDNVATLIREISSQVNGVVASAQAIIQQANEDIAALYDSLPADMQEWAQEQKAQFSERLDTLSQRVNETRDNFNRDLSQRAAQAVQEVRQRVEQLRQEARGFIGRAMDAIAAFIDDPIRAIINGLLELVGIPPASFWALVARIQQVIGDIADDPMNFANNLMEALKQGFQRFFDNIGTHLFNGLIDWLFSAMGSVGVTIPTDFSLKSIITFFLQLMGITWERIRNLLAKHVGEENVALIEQAWGLISTLIEQGPAGIWEMIKEQFNPQMILDMIIETAIEYVTEALIKQVAIRIMGMLNPAGLIAQAIELIYKLLKWLFENAARIFSLIETVVNGIGDIIAGNIGGMAEAVENALGQIVPIVIDFLAGLLGLGDLPDKIADKVKDLQDYVERMMDRAIGWLVGRARALLARMGGSGAEEDQQPRTNDEEHDQAVAEGITALRRHEQRYLDQGRISHEEAIEVSQIIMREHPVFDSIIVVANAGRWDYEYRASPTTEIEGKPQEEAGDEPEAVEVQGELEEATEAETEAASPPAAATVPNSEVFEMTDEMVDDLIAYWRSRQASEPDKHARYQRYINRLINRERPYWRQSEDEMQYLRGRYAGLEEPSDQISYKHGQEVPRGRRGSTRPDLVEQTAAVEIKRYKVSNISGLIRIVQRQVEMRREHMRAHMAERQAVIVDFRGEEGHLTPTVVADLRTRLASATNLPDRNIEIVVYQNQNP